MFGVISFLVIFLPDLPDLADLGEIFKCLEEGGYELFLASCNSSSNMSFLGSASRTDFESPSMLAPFGLTNSLAP